MWDSLETVWAAANEDKEYCNTYVVPIPYADLNPDHTAAKWHCEIDLFPKNVPVMDYRKLDLKRLKPDVIFIHNPYDQYNVVTSVDSNYYSFNLKQHTKLLVYVPYYATSGAMSEGQKYCPSYDHMDYIIMQAEAMRNFFDPSIPAEKLQPLGSPKFDRVVQMCNNPPKIPDKWQSKMNGRKVYFYNTSLNGLLTNTELYLNKMKYVFDCFKDRDDVCLLWRPHPLINATLASMRMNFQDKYNKLKNYFIENDIGIYDETPDIDKSIALSDVYIGDAATSVTSLFGMAGKPMFILNASIDTLPKMDDWKGEILRPFIFNCNMEAKDWLITQGNKLYCAPKHDYNYQFYCDLSDYAVGGYYLNAIEAENKLYVCPGNALDILIIDNHKIERTIQLNKPQNGTEFAFFYNAVHISDYIFLLPNRYPAIVRYNIKTGALDYVNGFADVLIQQYNMEFLRGGFTVWNEHLILSPPKTNNVLAINIHTLKISQIELPEKMSGGFLAIIPDRDNLWLLPYFGNVVVSLNIKEGTITEYPNLPEGFQCRRALDDAVCRDRPFLSAVCDENEVFLSPAWGNMFVRLNKKTGKMTEWKNNIPVSNNVSHGYFYHFTGTGVFYNSLNTKDIYYFHISDRQLYEFDITTKTFNKIDIQFNVDELKQQSHGFSNQSSWIPYSCFENAFQTLKDLLDETLPGRPFDKESQLIFYKHLNASIDGTAGEKIYQFVKSKLN